MKRQSHAAPVGAVSLMTVFAVVCLVVFALLSLSTALADRRLADSTLTHLTDCYEADYAAEEIFARLRSGEQVPGVQEQDGICRYHCPVDENRYLAVALEHRGESWQVLCWQTVNGQLPEQTGSLNLWTGEEQEGTP